MTCPIQRKLFAKFAYLHAREDDLIVGMDGDLELLDSSHDYEILLLLSSLSWQR